MLISPHSEIANLLPGLVGGIPQQDLSAPALVSWSKEELSEEEKSHKQYSNILKVKNEK